MLSKEILDFCKANANEDNVKKYSYYFKTEYVAWGLTSPQVNNKAKELAKSKLYSIDDIVASVAEICKTGKYEEISCIILMMKYFPKELTKNHFHQIEKLFSYSIDNWAHADTLAMQILPLFLKHKVVELSDFESWLVSEQKFQRRCVPVTLIRSLKEDKTADFRPFLYFCESLMSDPIREVHQGMGWFLREAWKIQSSPVEDFLYKWKETAPRLIIQYATEKMTSQEKLIYRREQKSKKTTNKTQ